MEAFLVEQIKQKDAEIAELKTRLEGIGDFVNDSIETIVKISEARCKALSREFGEYKKKHPAWLLCSICVERGHCSCRGPHHNCFRAECPFCNDTGCSSI